MVPFEILDAGCYRRGSAVEMGEGVLDRTTLSKTYTVNAYLQGISGANRGGRFAHRVRHILLSFHSGASLRQAIAMSPARSGVAPAPGSERGVSSGVTPAAGRLP